MPVAARQPLVSPTICAAVTGFLVGIGIGIGFGALIFDRPWNRGGGLGGGLWFGRRKRSVLDQVSQFRSTSDNFTCDIISGRIIILTYQIV
jgi:hypothetical protein